MQDSIPRVHVKGGVAVSTTSEAGQGRAGSGPSRPAEGGVAVEGPVVDRTAEPGPAVDGRADGGSPEAGEGTVSAPQPPGFRWVAAACAGVLTAVVIGVPTDIIANSWFTREIPV